MNVTYNALGSIFGGKSETDTTTASDNTTNGDNATAVSTKSETTMSRPAEGRLDAEDATIDFTTAAAVEHEQVTNVHEEKVQTVVDKEKHQDHYHTTIQPVKEQEVLPQEHDYNEAATIQRSFNNDDSDETKAKLAAEQAQFRDTTTQNPTLEKKTYEGTVAGNEQVHLHLHETIQPVIEKETIKPSVTHTTVPVHEVHQEASVVHGTSTAEPMTAEEFKNARDQLKSSK